MLYKDENLLKIGNQAFLSKNYKKAIDIYSHALEKYRGTVLESILIRNIDRTKVHLEKQETFQVSVIVPVFNALSDVKKCLESLTNAYKDYPIEIIIVNDCSNKETSDFLKTLSEKNNSFTLIEHKTNKGYTKAINSGLKASSGDYVVTLNSDTIVPLNWISRFLECFETDEKIGIAGPLSNAASWQNIPNLKNEAGLFAVNDIPLNLDVNNFQLFLDRYSLKRFPKVPFVNGFCFMIKREVIDEIGYMDEIHFPTGYGEENDFCIRAANKGFKLVIADNLYVFHAKSKSFGHEKRKKLSSDGSKNLRVKHGDSLVKNKIASIASNNDLPEIRLHLNKRIYCLRNASFNLSLKENLKIGFLLPVKGGSGGAHSVIQEATELSKMGCFVKVFVRDRDYEFISSLYEDIPESKKIITPYSLGSLGKFYFFSKTFDSNLTYLVKDLDILIATIFSSVEVLKDVISYVPSIMPAYYAQDYEPLFFEEQSDLYKKAYDSYSLIEGNIIFAKTNWIRNRIKKDHGITVKKVIPSIDENIYYERSRTLSSIRIIFAMIRPSTPRRGAERTMLLLKTLKDRFGNAIEINTFGCLIDDPKFIRMERNFTFEHHGILKRSEVAKLAGKSDIFIDLSDYQAFGRTGLEAMASGCVSILPKEGGADEYIINNVNSFQIDSLNNWEELINILAKLIIDQNYFESIKSKALLTGSRYNLRSAAMSELDILSRNFRNWNIKNLLKDKIMILYCGRSDASPTSSAFVRFLSLYNNYQPDNNLIFNYSPIKEFKNNYQNYSVVVFQRFYQEVNDIEEFTQLFEKLKKSSVKIVYDINDILFDKNILLEQKMAEKDSNIISSQSQYFIKNADFITTSNKEIQKMIKCKYNKSSSLLKNIISYSAWGSKEDNLNRIKSKKIKISTREKFKIGYFGTQSHEQDVIMIKDSITDLYDKYNFEFEVIGAFQNKKLNFGKRIGLPKNNSYPDFVNWIKIISSSWDIGLIPLINNEFSIYKSNIKFLEYAMLGIPIIVSESPIYQDIALHQKNCLIVSNTKSGWTEAITYLIENPYFREKLVNQAFIDVTNNYFPSNPPFNEYFQNLITQK